MNKPKCPHVLCEELKVPRNVAAQGLAEVKQHGLKGGDWWVMLMSGCQS